MIPYVVQHHNRSQHVNTDSMQINKKRKKTEWCYSNNICLSSLLCKAGLQFHDLSLSDIDIPEHTAEAESPPPPSSKTDHGEQFETETPGQLYMRQTFNSDN